MVKHPVDIATKHTVEFVDLYAGGRTLLEIGCGEGDVAASLMRSTFEVLAIDTDDDAVTAACAKGVNAVKAEWPDFLADKVSTVLFTRSLHHIHHLEEAVAAAYERLNNTGVLLIEDFAFDHADAKTICWFMELLSSDEVSKLLHAPPDNFIGKLLDANDPEEFWRTDHAHEHELHTIEAMQTAISEKFVTCVMIDAPYLYRYMIPALPSNRDAAKIVAAALKLEEDAIASKRISAIGKRIIATKTN